MYCKYCYRMLEDGSKICTACGKSQTSKKKNPKKLLGVFPIYREKDIKEAKRLFYHADAAYKLARESKTVMEFILYWNMLHQDNAALRTFQDVVPPDTFLQFSDILSKESEFQWRLRDAVEASKLSAIEDMKGDYRNNINERVISFSEDIDIATEVADPETSHFILSAIYEVTSFAGIKIEKPIIEADALHHTKHEQWDDFAKYGGTDAELLTIDLMEGHDFEQWCANALRDLGYANVKVTPGSGDQGVDVLAEKDSIKYAIQCKCYSSNLGNTSIQEVNAGKSFYRCHVGVVMTNQHFTSKAKELAEATGTLLWDRDWIVAYLRNKLSTEASLQVKQLHHENIPSNASFSIDGDEMLPAAVDIILETGQASVSMLQRSLKLGYARAARIVDEMEEKGIVGPFQGSKPRAILITKEQWKHMRPK